MSRFSSAAAAGIDLNEDDDYDLSGNVNARVERDFLRRNLSQFNSIYTSILQKSIGASDRDRKVIQPHFNSLANISIPHIQKLSPAEGICSHFLRRGFTKPIKYQLNAAVWSADARWLILGTQSGDFALWEGEQLKVHKVVSVPAHKVLTDGGKVQDFIPITAMAWNHYGNSLVSADNNGLIQY